MRHSLRPSTAARRSRAITRLALAIIFCTLAMTGGVVIARAAPSNCAEQFWMLGLRATTRTICDSPVRADGSWTRTRSFTAPAYWMPTTCVNTGGFYGGVLSCSGGYPVEALNQTESYVVTPATVLPDEPGHLGAPGTSLA